MSLSLLARLDASFLRFFVVASCWMTLNLGEGGRMGRLPGRSFKGFDGRWHFLCQVSVLILGDFLVEITVHQCKTSIIEVVC